MIISQNCPKSKLCANHKFAGECMFDSVVPQCRLKPQDSFGGFDPPKIKNYWIYINIINTIIMSTNSKKKKRKKRRKKKHIYGKQHTMWFISEIYNYATKRLYDIDNTKLQIKSPFFEMCWQFSFLLYSEMIFCCFFFTEDKWFRKPLKLGFISLNLQIKMKYFKLKNKNVKYLSLVTPKSLLKVDSLNFFIVFTLQYINKVLSDRGYNFTVTKNMYCFWQLFTESTIWGIFPLDFV